MADAPDVVDYLTLAAAVLAPAAAAWTTIWSVNKSESDKFSLHVDWKFFADPNAPSEEIPFLYIQNHSSRKILITGIQWHRGAWKRTEVRETALIWEDPTDLDFPYEIDAGAVRQFALSEIVAKQQFDRSKSVSKAFGRIGRSAIWIKVSTATGASKFIGGERVLPWKHRPDWTTTPDDD